MGEGSSPRGVRRREPRRPSSVWSQAGFVVSAGCLLGAVMSVVYYRALGPPQLWLNSTAGRREGGGWWYRDVYSGRSTDRRLVRSQGSLGGFGSGGETGGLDLAVGGGGLGVRVGGDNNNNNNNGPILGRSDDWPVAWPGDTRPYFDYLLVVFSGDDTDALAKRDYMREMYGTYGGQILITDERGQAFIYTFKVLYVVGHPGAVDMGDLMDDVLFVKVEKGYRNIAAKTKKMLEAVKHVRFKYLLKTDDDTFVCLRRTASQMHLVPAHIKPKVYGGIPTACHLPNNPNDAVGKVIVDMDDKWYDGKYLNHTMNGLDCYPVYMQGAFYILSYPLVEFLNQGSSKLLTFDNEDVTIGLWLHGVDRAIFPLNDLRDARVWECSCKRPNFNPGGDANVFFHNCKSMDDLRGCKASMPMC
ncbi:GT31 [Ectocarpus sp. CCAP 1310/34]|nr:GT31 [Ectocarpus sp. CCAP 1310/34]